MDHLLADLNKRLADRRVTVTLDRKAKEWAAEKGYDPVFGARTLKRFLQRPIETKLARTLISGEIGEDSTVTFRVNGDELVLGGAPMLRYVIRLRPNATRASRPQFPVAGAATPLVAMFAGTLEKTR